MHRTAVTTKAELLNPENDQTILALVIGRYLAPVNAPATSPDSYSVVPGHQVMLDDAPLRVHAPAGLRYGSSASPDKRGMPPGRDELIRIWVVVTQTACPDSGAIQSSVAANSPEVQLAE